MRMWEKAEDEARPQVRICRIRIACWIPKTTDAHSEYALLNCFFTATVVMRTRLNAALYIHYLFCYSVEPRPLLCNGSRAAWGGFQQVVYYLLKFV
jgi:hypothetical protein